MNLSKEKQQQLEYHPREIEKLLKEQPQKDFSTFEEGEQLLRKILVCEGKELENLTVKNKGIKI